eukprot:TRINITY_DN7228_c0_g2_i2.p1 TRINITY_DN7228_c0_g2~~TRINITY_DN7228_c0_g2_i2.p1  ORF type:complete len:366 (-),score=54.17 TRINITY_DN7228_c0_g2_i2:103-1200(-)
MDRVSDIESKCKAVRSVILELGLSAIALTQRPNFSWITSGGCNHIGTASEIGAATIVVTKDRLLCITNSIEAKRIRDEELDGTGIVVESFNWWESPLPIWQQFDNVASDAPIPIAYSPLPTKIRDLRFTLTAFEMSRYRVLGEDVCDALERSCLDIERGSTELELAALIAKNLLVKGIRAPVLLVAADERASLYRHPLPSHSQRISNYCMAVCCGERQGLFVSCTRMFSFGAVSAELQQKHAAVCAVDAAMIAATVPGARFADIFAVAQRAYSTAGFADEWTQHHQGGLTGYMSRECKADPGCVVVVQCCQAFAWNPTITGTKSEDTILIREDGGCEVLSASSRWPQVPVCVGSQTIVRCGILQR